MIPSICPRCGGKNFQWASKCDHCGLPLAADGVSADLPPVAQAPDDGERIVDLEAHREEAFHASLAATTPYIFVTPVLIVVNVVVFLAMLARHVSAVAPPPETLIRWGANYGPSVTHGQWWRLVTSAFVHIGVTHLLVNMFVLFVIGRFTERLFGNVGFVVLYLLGAVAASLTSLSMHPMTVSAGASGAVFALYGGLIGFLLVRRSTMSYATATSLALNAIGFVAFNLFNGLIKPHIDMAAHVGGLVAGVPIGSALAFRLATGTAAARLLRSAIVCAAGAAIAVAVARRLPVLDDWPREFTNWVSFTRDTANRFNTLRDEGLAGRATPAQIADRIERELVPSVDAEHARLERLRLLPDQKAVARNAVEYLSVQAEALRLTAAAERSRDPAVADQAAEKADQAAEVMLRIIPDVKLAALLEERKAARASARALSAEIKAISDLEKEQAGIYNPALTDYRSKKITAEDLGTLIDERVLPPWVAERHKLSTLRVVPTQEPHVKRFLEYMTLRADGWRLIAAGLRSNDRRLVEQGTAKQAAAKRLMETNANQPLEPRSRGPQTPR